MAISEKGKRKLRVEGRDFLWWVFDEYDQTEFDGVQVKIVAKDQSVMFKYGVQQTPEKRYLMAALGRDQGKVHVRCPAFETEEGIITPGGVATLIQWASNKREFPCAEIVHSYRRGVIPDRSEANEIRLEICDRLNIRDTPPTCS